jgi:uncharacterized protein (DUF1778 family)
MVIKKQKQPARYRQLAIRLTDEEFEAIKKAAQDARRTASDWVRSRCLMSMVIPRFGK